MDRLHPAPPGCPAGGGGAAAEQKLQREVGKTREELERRRSRSIRRREEIAQQVDAAERTFAYKGQPLLMLQHLKIGVKDSPHRTLRLHFEWDAEDGVVVIGHCEPHLSVQGH